MGHIPTKQVEKLLVALRIRVSNQELQRGRWRMPEPSNGLITQQMGKGQQIRRPKHVE